MKKATNLNISLKAAIKTTGIFTTRVFPDIQYKR